MSDHKPVYSKTELELKISSEISSAKLQMTRSHAAALSAVKTASFSEGMRKGAEEKEKETRKIIEKLREEMELKEREHESVLEEMITKLDDFEAEHNEELIASKAAVEQKDVVLSAFSEQLQTAKLASQKFKEEADSLTAANESLTSQLAALQRQLESVKVDHEEAMAAEKEKRLRAVENMKNEVQTEAEKQFSEANKLYNKLKENHSSQSTEIKQLNTQLQQQVRVTLRRLPMQTFAKFLTLRAPENRANNTHNR